MHDVGEGGCIGDGTYDVACDEDEDVEYQAVDDFDQQRETVLVLRPHLQQLQQQQQQNTVSAGHRDSAAQAESAAAAAAAAKVAVGGGGTARSGKLSMLVWNDVAALFDLEAVEGVGMRAAGFGGSAREA
jgi:hypothetical protein